MATLVVTFAFATDVQSFTSSAGVNSVLSYNAGTGNPAGSLQSAITGKSHTNSNSWTRTATWEALGVPTGSIITGITSASCQSRCTTFTTGAASSCLATLTDNATVSSNVTLASSRSFSATDGAFVTTNGVDNTTLHTPSNATVSIVISNTLVTGASNTAAVTLLQDQLTFTITYTVAPSDTISFVSAKSVASAVSTSTSGSFIVSDGPNRCVVVCLQGDAGRVNDDITAMTLGGSAMTLLTKVLNFSAITYAYYYYMLNPPSGSQTLQATCTNSHNLSIIAAEYTGVLNASQPDVSTTNASAANGTSLTTGLTSTVDNDWMVLCEWGLSTGNAAPGASTGSTFRVAGGSGASGIFDSNGAITPPGSYSMTTTRVSTGGNWIIVHIAAMLEPAGLPDSYVPPPRRGTVVVNRTVYY